MDADWPCIARSREFMSVWEKADPWVLKVIINYNETGRDRSQKGEERLRVHKAKKQYWMRTNVWPWWIFVETEAHHWSAKIKQRDVQGGQCEGGQCDVQGGQFVECLESGVEGATEALAEYEAPSIEAHGE